MSRRQDRARYGRRVAHPGQGTRVSGAGASIASLRKPYVWRGDGARQAEVDAKVAAAKAAAQARAATS